ncbi:MAG TPA: murein biosynthesis integral membrane protein MurJ [bacterium]|nr:murein biosynthesis integral membrane protein MurJ [bacterium]
MDNSSFVEKSLHNVTQEPGCVNRHCAQETPEIPAPSVTPETGKTHKHLLKAAGLMGALTLCSRILGMIRDIVSAKNFGTIWQWDSFLYAFMLPNFFRKLVGEGALSSAFIPVYSEILAQKGKEEAFRFGALMFTLLATGLFLFLLVVQGLLITALSIGHFPPIVRLTLELLRWMFPYLWFMSLFVLGMGILNSHRHFFAPALGPIIFDLFWIAGVIWVTPRAGTDFQNQVRWLTVVILISGAAQLLAELPALYRIGFKWRWVWDLAYPGLKKTYHLFLPAILGFAVVQINILVDATCGLVIGPGANSSLWYGNRLMQFPLGIFAIAMGTALLPTVSHQTAKKDLDSVRKTLSFALRSIFLIILPASVGLMILGGPIVQLLFQRGQFDAVSTSRTAAVLWCYSIGLFAYSGQKIFAAGFYAAQDTRTPVKIGIIALCANIVLNLILMVPMAEAGLALATSISGVLQFSLLCFFYQRKITNLDLRKISWSFIKITWASLAMGILGWISFKIAQNFMPGSGTMALLIQVFSSIFISIAAYIGFCLLFRVHEVREAFLWIRERKRKNRGPVTVNGALTEA